MGLAVIWGGFDGLGGEIDGSGGEVELLFPVLDQVLSDLFVDEGLNDLQHLRAARLYQVVLQRLGLR